MITKRGLAVRSWNDHLSTTRAAIMSGDSRLCQANMATVPRVQLESSGWPSHVTAIEIVKACVYYTKLAPVPSRAYRVSGITFWSLLFSEAPAIQKFSVTFDGTTYEILLMKSDPQQLQPSRKQKSIGNPDKPIGKGNGKGASKAVAPSVENEANSDRLTSLESKMALMDKRQTSLENRVDSQFQEVNNQLRQILQCVAPREQSHAATGFTPPPKQAKTGQ